MARKSLPRAPRAPAYTQKARQITPDQLTWGAREGRAPQPVAPRTAPDGKPARLPSDTPLGNMPQGVKPYACPFCGAHDHEHECAEYDRLLARYRASRTPVRCGVPWSWVSEFYAAKGEVPPMPRAAYDPPLRPGEEGYDG